MLNTIILKTYNMIEKYQKELSFIYVFLRIVNHCYEFLPFQVAEFILENLLY